MTIPEMIAEWRKGCSVSQMHATAMGGAHNPAQCKECTTALIEAIERKAAHMTVDTSEAEIPSNLQGDNVDRYRTVAGTLVLHGISKTRTNVLASGLDFEWHSQFALPGNEVYNITVSRHAVQPGT